MKIMMTIHISFSKRISRNTHNLLSGLLCFIIFICLIPVTTFSVQAATGSHYGDTIYFSGFPWVVKESNGKQTGPGLNYFSGSQENIWVDQQGHMHLKLTMRDEKWYCPEVRMINQLGYGQYIFHLDTISQVLDQDVVIGLFVYDHSDTSNFHKEVDIEFSKWGKESSVNTQFVVQPHEEKAFRFQTDLSLPTKHVMEIRKKSIRFISSYETGLNHNRVDSTVAEWKYKPEKAYHPGNETISMNIWLYKASEPYNLKEMEVVITKFEFIPGRK